MSDGLTDLLGDLSDDAPVTGGALRKQLEQIAAKNRELTEQLAQFQAEKRATSVAGLLEKHGVPAVAKDLFTGDPTDESVTEFVSKYGALWGAQATPATTPAPQQAAANALQQFASQANQPVAQPLSEDDYRAKFAEAKSREEFLQMLNEAAAAAG